MALIDKVEIVFTNNGKRKKVLLSWLLSQAAEWAFDANPFVVQDNKLAEKIKGETFNGRDVKPQLIAKYHYLKTVLDEAEQDLYIDNTTEDETEAQEHQIEDAEQTVLEEVLSDNIDDLKKMLDDKGIKYDKRKKGLEYFQELVKKS